MRKDKVVTISENELRELEADRAFLYCLQSAGVQNWSGYEEAQELYSEKED